MDANKIKINRKRCLGNTSISDFFKPKVYNIDGNNNASSSVISNPPFYLPPADRPSTGDYKMPYVRASHFYKSLSIS